MYLKAERMYMFYKALTRSALPRARYTDFLILQKKKTKLREDKRTLTAAAEISQHLLYCRKGRERLSHLLEVQSGQAHMVTPLLLAAN